MKKAFSITIILSILITLTTNAIASDKRQLAADKAQCADYGIRRGTKEFSACLIQIDQARQQQAQQQLLQARILEAQQQIQQQAIQKQEAARRAAVWDDLSNFGFAMMAAGGRGDSTLGAIGEAGMATSNQRR